MRRRGQRPAASPTLRSVSVRATGVARTVSKTASDPAASLRRSMSPSAPAWRAPRPTRAASRPQGNPGS